MYTCILLYLIWITWSNRCEWKTIPCRFLKIVFHYNNILISLFVCSLVSSSRQGLYINVVIWSVWICNAIINFLLYSCYQQVYQNECYYNRSVDRSKIYIVIPLRHRWLIFVWQFLTWISDLQTEMSPSAFGNVSVFGSNRSCCPHIQSITV